MEVLEQGEKIVFLRKLKEGPAAESYGIHVAMLAGLSENVLQRARQIMALLKERDEDLELSSLGEISGSTDTAVNRDAKKVNPVVSQGAADSINKFEKMLQEIEPEEMTPLEALNILCRWKKLQQAGIDIPVSKPKARSGRNDDAAPSLFDLL